MIGIIALLQTFEIIKSSPILWQSIILVAGLFLASYLLLHHGVEKVPLVWSLILNDPQQRQHLLMAFLLRLAGLTQILVHEKHGSIEAVKWAQRIHKYLGILLILASIAFVCDSFSLADIGGFLSHGLSY